MVRRRTSILGVLIQRSVGKKLGFRFGPALAGCLAGLRCATRRVGPEAVYQAAYFRLYVVPRVTISCSRVDPEGLFSGRQNRSNGLGWPSSLGVPWRCRCRSSSLASHAHPPQPSSGAVSGRGELPDSSNSKSGTHCIRSKLLQYTQPRVLTLYSLWTVTVLDTQHARDVTGYGPDPPDAKWPGGALVALNFVLNVEEGSEPSVPDGDSNSSAGLCECGSDAP